MAAKKTPGRKPKMCVVCLTRRQTEWSLCGPCDNDYAISLADGMGSIEWAARRAREQMALQQRRDKSARAAKK